MDRAGVSSETVESERGMNSQLNYSVLCDLRKKEFSELRDVLLWPREGGVGAIQRINLESPDFGMTQIFITQLYHQIRLCLIEKS